MWEVFPERRYSYPQDRRLTHVDMDHQDAGNRLCECDDDFTIRDFGTDKRTPPR